MGGTAVEPGAEKKAEDLKPAAEAIGETATYVQYMSDAQTSSKWGSEAGPHTFRTKYAEVLDDAYTDITALEQELTAYVDAVHDVVQKFKGLDRDSASAQYLLESQATHQQDQSDDRNNKKPGGSAWAPTPA